MKLMKKTALSAIDLAAWLTESKSYIAGSRIESVYSLNQIYLFRLRGKLDEKTLVVKPGSYLYVTNLFERNLTGIEPHATLNQYLRGERIIEIEQVDQERILKFSIGSTDHTTEMYIEFFSSGQLAVVKNEKIIYLMSRYRGKDRILEPGRPYELPPSRGNPIEDAGKLQTKGPALMSLTHSLSFPPEGVKEALVRSGISPDKELGLDELSKVLDTMKEIWALAKRPDAIKPTLIQNDDNLMFHPFPFKSDEAVEAKEFSSFNSLLETVFSTDLVERPNTEAEKMRKAIEEAEKAALDHEEKATIIQGQVEVLSSLAPQINQAIEHIHYVQKRSGWSAVNTGEINGLHLNKIIPNGAQVYFEETGDVPIRANENIWGQITQLHEKALQEKKKAENAKEKIKELREKLELKVKVDEGKGLEAAMRANRKREWYERFRWFFSSDGTLVIAGKDSDQNIALIRNYLKPNQLALHADVHGSPLAIIQKDADYTTEKTVSETAQFVACYSKAWSSGSLSAKVSAFLGNQVSLSPPSGTFLSKGSFMIYGKKKEVEVELKLAIGVEVNENWFRVISGPPDAVRAKTNFIVTLVPGGTPRQELVQEVKKRLSYALKKASSQVSYMIKISDIEPFLPGGSGDVQLEP